jgi:hypothetical protein
VKVGEDQEIKDKTCKFIEE